MQQFELPKPNTCAQCGGNPGPTVFAKNMDEVRAGQGICGKCANIVTPGAAEDDQAVTNDLTAIRGIGPKRAEDFQALGIQSFQQLAEANPEILAVQLGAKPDEVAKWQEEAARLSEGE